MELLPVGDEFFVKEEKKKVSHLIQIVSIPINDEFFVKEEKKVTNSKALILNGSIELVLDYDIYNIDVMFKKAFIYSIKLIKSIKCNSMFNFSCARNNAVIICSYNRQQKIKFNGKIMNGYSLILFLRPTVTVSIIDENNIWNINTIK